MGRNESTKGGRTSRARTHVGAYSGLLLACAVAGTLLVQTGIASAASRGFTVKNDSTHALRVASVSAIPRLVCLNLTCIPAYYDMEFEGRPADGSVIKKGGDQRWELKYFYWVGDVFGASTNYAAKLTYNVEGTAGKFEAVIKTSNYSNNSTCEVVPKNLGSCAADGLRITFK
ncbi:MAG: hypothetical protein WAK93_21395 [Solirubrobacteraceae bacterium]